MKLTHLLGAAIVLFASTASAHDLTYTGPIKEHETKNIKVELPAGKLTVEVFSSGGDTKFNCSFATSYAGVVFVQNNTPKCVGNVVMTSDSSMMVTVTNLSKESDYKIWVHDTP